MGWDFVVSLGLAFFGGGAIGYRLGVTSILARIRALGLTKQADRLSD